MAKESIVTVLDIGSSKVCALSGKLDSDGKIDVLGMGLSDCRGIQQGTVVDINATEEAIYQALEEVNATSGFQAHSIYISSGGIHVAGRSSQGTTAVRGKEVEEDDIRAVINAAKAVSFPQDESLIHILPQSFSIEGQQNIRQPLGMSGIRLEAHCYLISGISNTLRNLRKCVARFNLSVDRIVVEQIADTYSSLRQDEKESGVCLINLGAGTTKFIIIKNNAPVYIRTLPVGGENVTNDLATALKVPAGLAEDYKRRYGCVSGEKLNDDDMIRMARVDYRSEESISRQTLAGFIQPRYMEIFELIEKELLEKELRHKIPAGVVLVGGAARLEGLAAYAAEILHSSVRIGTPDNLSQKSEFNDLLNSNSAYVTACGLLGFALEENMHLRQADGFFSGYGHMVGGLALFDRFSNWMTKRF